MRYIAIFLLLLSSSVLGAPFVITNLIPNTGPNSTCNWFMDTVPGVAVPIVIAMTPPVGNFCQLDLGPLGLIVGPHSITVSAFNPPDPLWGGGGPSPKSAPLAFTKPASSAPPPAPDGLRLTP